MNDNGLILVVEHEGVHHYWFRGDFEMVYKNKLYALKKQDEWYPIMIEKLLKQNNVNTMEKFIEKYNKQFNIKIS